MPMTSMHPSLGLVPVQEISLQVLGQDSLLLSPVCFFDVAVAMAVDNGSVTSEGAAMAYLEV